MTVLDSGIVRSASLYHGSDGADTVKHDRVITGSGVTTAGGHGCQVSIAARILSRSGLFVSPINFAITIGALVD